MDLTRYTGEPIIPVMQNDRYSRNVEISLFSGNEPWVIPEGISVLIRYQKADGKGGEYDTMPDGSAAWSAAENVLTAALAPQVLTVPGAVTLTITLLQESAQISIFSIILNVKAVANVQSEPSEDYYYAAGFLPAPASAEEGQYLRVAAVNASGYVTAVEAVDQSEVTTHNESGEAHPDIRRKLDEKLDVQEQTLTDEQMTQVRQNIGIEEVLEKTTEIVTGINLNDGVYEFGRFNSAGEDYSDAVAAYAFRNANYLEVEGGRSVVAYYEPAAWNLNADGWMIDIVQYDSAKNVIAARTSINNYHNSTGSDSVLALDADAAYIRICYNRSGTTVFEDLTEPEIAVYYLEDAVQEFVEYTIAEGHTVLWIDKSKIKDLDPLKGRKIVYDGDSICAGTAENSGGGYAKLIAEQTGSSYVNHAQGGARLCSGVADHHCIADNLENLPAAGDLYCFQGGINDYWGSASLGTFTMDDFTGDVDPTTVCGALETIFRYMLNHFPGKPVCFIITHKIQFTAYSANSAGDTFRDYRDAMAAICEKYSIPYYDAFSESGLNGWNEAQSNLFLTGNGEGTPDGCHPNEEGHRRYYVPQLLALFRRILPAV